MKLLSLNLKEDIEWNKRKDKIVEIIKELDPDICAFQEVFTYIEGRNTLEDLNYDLNYKFFSTIDCFDYSKDYGKGKLKGKNGIVGLGILAKQKFSHKIIELPIKIGYDRWPRKAMMCEFSDFKLINTHFSNKIEESREKQWKCMPDDAIIIGDLNTPSSEINKFTKNKICSYDIKKYISYPKDNTAYDYIILPRGEFLEVKAIDENISDHLILYAEIELPQPL